MNHEFSPQVLQLMTLAQQFEQQNELHLAQVAANHATGSCSFSGPSQANSGDGGGGGSSSKCHRPESSTIVSVDTTAQKQSQHRSDSTVDKQLVIVAANQSDAASEPITLAAGQRPKKSISFAFEPEQRPANLTGQPDEAERREVLDESGRQLVNRRLSSICALPSYMRRKSSRLNSLVPRTQARGRIEFRDVEFAYPNRPSALVLDGFSLSVLPGESVALVGSSGSGKSTCVAILEKFYDFHAGKVTLDGRDLRLMDNNWTRSQIGLVSQEPTLLSYTIGDNIRYGDNSRFVSMEEVVEAARTANIHDFIMSLPDQYDTELSTSTYSSSQLSGGQRQRIAIARALIRNAPILIFDEATSALDSRNETVVQDALNKARRGRTNLTIAHRLATVRDADKIAVLRDGQVVEVGRHEELLRNAAGHYRSLWERQEGALSGNGAGGDNEQGDATSNLAIDRQVFKEEEAKVNIEHNE